VTLRRITAAVAVLAAVGMARTAWLHFVSEPRHGAGRARIDPRYAAVRPLLPASGHIGYVSDLPPASRLGEMGDERGTELYIQAQYALAPLVLRPDDSAAALVLANLVEAARLRELAGERRLSVIAVAGPGVAVLRPDPP
jgi:hypothetical protein